jgi:hypothetical protein
MIKTQGPGHRTKGENNDRAFYVETRKAEECLCGREKSSGRSFCYHCYKELPGDMQKALYRQIGDGYEEAFEDAVAWLQTEVW